LSCKLIEPAHTNAYFQIMHERRARKKLPSAKVKQT